MCLHREGLIKPAQPYTVKSVQKTGKNTIFAVNLVFPEVVSAQRRTAQPYTVKSFDRQHEITFFLHTMTIMNTYIFDFEKKAICGSNFRMMCLCQP